MVALCAVIVAEPLVFPCYINYFSSYVVWQREECTFKSIIYLLWSCDNISYMFVCIDIINLNNALVCKFKTFGSIPMPSVFNVGTDYIIGVANNIID